MSSTGSRRIDSFKEWADREFGPSNNEKFPQEQRYASYYKCWKDAQEALVQDRPALPLNNDILTLNKLKE